MGACKELMRGSVVDRGHSKSETDQMKRLLVFQGKIWSAKLVQLRAERDGSPDICHVKGVFTTDSLRSQREPERTIMCLPTLWQWGFGALTKLRTCTVRKKG